MPPKRSPNAIQRRGSTSNRVQVAVRVRPVSKYDAQDAQEVIRVEGNSVLIGKPGDKEKRFIYDNVFTEGQEVVYENIGCPMLSDAFEGYNVCLFAYGQTGSGKTFSILGEVGDADGIIPRFCTDMFATAQERLDEDPTLTIKISMSYAEIYNEKVRDLLEKRRKGVELTSLEIHETPDHKVYVEGLSVHTVLNVERIRQLIDQGSSQRQVSETKMNEKSSRSHSILQFYLSQSYDPPTPEKKDTESLVTMVDLAGSERQSKTEATGQQLDESKNINRSLLMLGRALNSFSDGSNRTHVPLRESKLTRLLSECFGGNARTWMLACVSPSAFNYSESMSTLEYAQNAKAIINKAKVNSVQQRLELKELREQHQMLTTLFEGEKQATASLQHELVKTMEELERLKQENIDLHRRLQEMESTTMQVEVQLSTARGEVKQLLTTHTSPLTSQPRGDGAQMYIGRAKVSLRNIIEQTSDYLTLPLVSDIVEPDGPQPQLVVNIYPVDSKGCSTLDTPKTKCGPKDLIGHRVDFVVHIIDAKGIPKKYTHCVYCKYVYKWAEKDSYRTLDVRNTCNPEFDFKKRFAFSKMNQGLVDYFLSDNVITFEVIGEAYPSGLPNASA